MTVTVEAETGGGSRCVIGRDMTIYTALELKEPLLGALAQCHAMKIDLAGVGEIDSAGLQLLVMAKTEAAAQGKTLSLSGHSPAVLEILELCNLESFFGDPVLIQSRG